MVRTALLMVLAALVVSGCGRRGSLEEPGRVENETVRGAALPGSADYSSPGAVAPDVDRPDSRPDRPFALDPLI